MDDTRPQKIVALHQPVYLPFVGFFRKMALADEFMFMDFVPLSRQSWQVRNRVKTAAGPVWLTVPVFVKGRAGQLIRDVRVVPSGWERKHWETIRQSYSRAPYFHDYAPFFAEVYGRRWEWLVELNIFIIEGMRRFLNINTPLADNRKLIFKGTKTDLVVDICKKLGATAYLSSDGEAAYIQPEKFAAAGIEHRYLGWRPTPYPQLHGPFIPNLSAIDLLFNCGPAAADIVRGEPAAENHPANHSK